MDRAPILYHHLFLLCRPLHFSLMLLEVIVLLMSREKIPQKALSSICHISARKNTELKIAEQFTKWFILFLAEKPVIKM